MNFSVNLNNYENTSSTPLPDDYNVIFLTSLVICILSIIGCLVNLAIIALMKEAAGNFAKLVVMISLSDMFFCIAAILEGNLHITSGGLCQFIVFLENAGLLASNFWTACFAHFFLKNLENGTFLSVDIYFRKYFVIATFSSVAFSF